MRATRNPLWRRAPLVLRRFPGIAAALVAGAALLAIAAAAGPLFVASAGSAALEQELDAVTPYGAGLFVAVDPAELTTPGAASLDERTEAFDTERGRVDGLGPTVVTVVGPSVPAANPERPEQTLDVRLLARTGALDHVNIVAGSGEDGVWLASSTAEELGLEPGDEVALATERVRVAGLYRSLFDEQQTPYWRSLNNFIYPEPPAFVVPPTFAIADQATALGLAEDLNMPNVAFRWEAPLAARDLSLSRGEALAGDVAEFERRLQTPETPLHQTFTCLDCFSGKIEFASRLATAVKNARITAATVRAPVDLLVAAGQLIALAVLAAVGVFSLERRKAEATLLNARGTGPGMVAAVAVLEAVAPVLFGLLLGLAVAYGAIAVLGPGGQVDPAAIWDAVTGVAVRAPVALAALGLVVAVAFAREFRTRDDGRRSFVLPWELVALALAGWFLVKLLGGDAVVVQSDGVSRPSAYLLLFPIFAIAGVAGLAARLFVGLARIWRRRSARRSGPAAYLAAHRLAAARRLLLVLVTACAVAFGLFIYAEIVVTSYRATVSAASLLGLGSDARGLTSFDRDTPDDPAIPTTKVTQLPAGGSVTLDGAPVNLLAVDPQTFEAAVHWDEGYASEPLAEILRRLDEGGDPLPVALVTGDADAELLSLDAVDVRVDVVASPRAFPRMSNRWPTVVVSAQALGGFFSETANPLAASAASTQILARGDPGPAARALEKPPTRAYPIVTAQELEHRPSVTVFTRTFSFLEALGLVAGLLGLVGLVVYMQARARSRALAYGFARRMGLAPRSHVRALVVELGLALLLSFALSVVLAAAAARLVLTRIEPLASISPIPLVEFPVALFLGVAAVLGLVAVVGAFTAHRSAARANLAEVLRLGD